MKKLLLCLVLSASALACETDEKKSYKEYKKCMNFAHEVYGYNDRMFRSDRIKAHKKAQAYCNP